MKIISALATAFTLCTASVFFVAHPAAPLPQRESSSAVDREIYELRIYRIFDFEKQSQTENYLRQALLPALNRQGLDRIGVFTNLDDENDHSIYMLIPFKSMESFAGHGDALFADPQYREAARNYFDRPLKNPAFARIESRLLRAFKGMPVIELPAESKTGQPRIFELRIYESPTEESARRKIEMFDQGETQLMRDVEMDPVFFGETLIGADAPNLVYLLSAGDREQHKQHWDAFLKHPDWERMKKIERYKDTVSKIKNWFLRPTSYSQL